LENILKSKRTKGIVETFETVFIAVAVCAVIYLTIAVPNKVEGQSMEPNFHQGDLVLTNKTIQYIGATGIGQDYNYDYQRGDVVIARQGKTDLIKRVIALEGETVEIKDNSVYINGEKLREKYLPTTTRSKLPAPEFSLIREGKSVVVPENSYFIMGDNREHSKDSRFREIGFISRNRIKGRVVFRYWPLSSIGVIHRGEFE